MYLSSQVCQSTPVRKWLQLEHLLQVSQHAPNMQDNAINLSKLGDMFTN